MLQFTTVTDERKTDSAVLDMAVAVLKKRLMGNGMGLHPKIGLLAEYRQGWSTAWGQGDPEDDDGEVSSLTVEWGPKGSDGDAPSYTLKKENFTTVSLYEANSTRFLGIFGHVRLDQNSQIFSCGYEDRTQHSPVDLLFFYDAAGTVRARDPSFRLSGDVISPKAAEMWSRRTSYATIGHSDVDPSRVAPHYVSEYQNKISAFVTRAISPDRSHFIAGLACGWRWADVTGSDIPVSTSPFSPTIFIRKFLRDAEVKHDNAFSDVQDGLLAHLSPESSSDPYTNSRRILYPKEFARAVSLVELLICTGGTLERYAAATVDGGDLLEEVRNTYLNYRVIRDIHNTGGFGLMVREGWGGKTVAFQKDPQVSQHGGRTPETVSWDSLDSALADLPEHVAKAVAIINIKADHKGISKFSANFGGREVVFPEGSDLRFAYPSSKTAGLRYQQGQIEGTLQGIDGQIIFYIIMPEMQG